MNVTYTCRQCDHSVKADVPQAATDLVCTTCSARVQFSAEDFDGDKLRACLVCGCEELFLRKDFSQRMGVGIVVIGFALSTIAWGFHWRFASYAILFATALIDVVLYLTVGTMLQCYRCHAEYRQSQGASEFGPFDLTTHERFRQQALRMAESKKV